MQKNIMPPIDPSQFIRTLRLKMNWSAASTGTPDQTRSVRDALYSNRVQIEREIEDCIDHGLRGKGFEDSNTRVRIALIDDSIQFELSIQTTFASLVHESVENIMTVAQKVDECAGSVLRMRVSRQDARVTEQTRQVRLERTPPNVVPAQPVKAAAPAAKDATNLEKKVQQLAVWMAINTMIALMALIALAIMTALLLRG